MKYLELEEIKEKEEKQLCKLWSKQCAISALKSP